MKKVGILTFHAACNYGAFLQAFSMQKVLNSRKNISCEIIDYVCPPIENNYKLTSELRKSGNIVKKIAKCILRMPAIIRRNKAFREARNDLHMTSERVYKSDTKALEKLYDLFIVGSDQVWNYELTGGDETYFLSFVNDQKKKSSYAVSLGSDKLQGDVSHMVELIRSFSNICIREKSALESLEKETGRDDIECCLDPVFLTSRNDWLKYAENSDIKKSESYILVFAMGSGDRSKNMVKFAYDLAKKTGKKLLYLSDQDRFYKYRDIKHIKKAAPKDFVKLIADADYVVTNSFHATAFSIILHTPFYTETDIKRSSRVTDILSLTGLSGQGLYKGKLMEKSGDIDWERSDKALSNEIKHSYDYLEKILYEQ